MLIYVKNQGFNHLIVSLSNIMRLKTNTNLK